MSSDVRERITDWLTGNDTCFLLGAGCSACASKPLIGELTERVLNGIDQKLLDQFAGLKAVAGRTPTIEDLINYLVRYREILCSISTGTAHGLSIDEIDAWLVEIKRRIVNEVADDWSVSDHHRRFLQRLQGARDKAPRDIFTLNYDTLIEASLDSLRLPYVDGFRGTNRAWFEPQSFDDAAPGTAYRVYKLHGSINWTRDADGHVRRGRNANEDAAGEPVVVYPSEQKYLQTQYGVYETLMGRFRNRLRRADVNNHLIVLGYSFNDEHINEAICDAITSPHSNLTVIAFVGPEKDRGSQDERLRAFCNRCDFRFSVFVGGKDDGRLIGHALDSEAARGILQAELWRFENLVSYVAGGDS